MNAIKNELDVDFIGGVGSLTKDEERRISEFIQSHKKKLQLAAKKETKKVSAKKVTM